MIGVIGKAAGLSEIFKKTDCNDLNAWNEYL